MKEDSTKKRKPRRQKSVDFSKGVRGKYARMKLVVVGASGNAHASSAVSKTNADAVLKKVSRVLNSAGSSKREMESAISRARQLIDAAGNM